MELAYYNNIDEFLGQRDGRYFGEGYLKSAQTIRNFELSGGLLGMRFTCFGEVNLPDIWSLKGNNQHQPQTIL